MFIGFIFCRNPFRQFFPPCRSMALPCILQLTTATPFSPCRLLTAYQRTIQHTPIPSIESHHIPSVVFPGFVTPGPVLLTPAVVRCLRSTSIVFVIVSFDLQSIIHYYPIRLLPLVPFPATGGPGNSNNTCLHLSVMGSAPQSPPAPQPPALSGPTAPPSPRRPALCPSENAYDLPFR